VRLLLARGADPDGSPEVTSPLLYATIFDHREIGGLLLDAGADPNRGGPAAATALRAAAAISPFGGFSESQAASVSTVACVLTGHAPNLPPLIAAIALGLSDTADALLAHGADPAAVASFEPPITAAGVAATIRDRIAYDRLLATGAPPAEPFGPLRPHRLSMGPC